jgi:hypothetical protein
VDHYEWLIALGVQTVLFLAGGYGMVLKNDWSNQALKDQLLGMEEELKQLAKVITEKAVQSTRIDNLVSQVTMLQRNVEDLRRGNGFVRGQRGIDHEYKD